MRRSQRSTKRFDYDLYHSVGEKVDISQSLPDISASHDYENYDKKSNSSTDVSQREVNSNILSVDNIQCLNKVDLSTNSSKDIIEIQESKHYSSVIELTNLFDNISFDESNRTVMCDPIAKQLIQKFNDIHIEISEFIDENSLNYFYIEDIDVCLNEIKRLRSSFRSNNTQLKDLICDDYEGSFGKRYELQLSKISVFIKSLMADRQSIRESQVTGKKDPMKNLANEMKINEVRRLIEEADDDMKCDLKLLSDSEIRRRNSSKSEQVSKMTELSKCFKELFCLEMDDMKNEKIVTDLTLNYNRVMGLKHTYSKVLSHEFESRELDKEDLFKSAKLNIQIKKFTGYNSTVDIYTFQDEFNKIYERSTPRRMIADLLKNNFLGDPALSLVKTVNDIDEVWSRLKAAYGDPKSLLLMKFNEVTKVGLISKINEPCKIMETLSKLVNLMQDLIKLAEIHGIENKLYHGDGIERIYRLMGDTRVTKWLNMIADDDLDEKRTWKKLIKFFEREIKVQQQKHLLCERPVENSRKRTDHATESSSYSRSNAHQITQEVKKEQSSTCHICGEDDHVKTPGGWGSQLVQYFSCKKFVEMDPAQRFAELWNKNLCSQCLYPGADKRNGKHRDGNCQKDFICKHPSHQKYLMKKHVLVCYDHRNNDENKKVLEEYKSKCIARQTVELPKYSKEIKLSFHSNSTNHAAHSSLKEESFEDNAIYVLQTILVDGKRYTIFYDSGCGDLVCRYDAIKRLGKRAIQERSGPIILGGVGDLTTESPYGVFKINLTLHNGMDANLSGVCIDKVTNRFPNYPLKTVEKEVQTRYLDQGGKINDLPKLAKYVGGDTDFLVGVKYLRYHPKVIFQLPSGLTVYESMFENADGGRGVIGGPHRIFTEIDSYHHSTSANSNIFFTDQLKLFRTGYSANCDLPLLNVKFDKDFQQDMLSNKDNQQNEYSRKQALMLRRERLFNQVEDAGSEILYRCPNCRSCKECKDHEHIEFISIKEEIEQDVINKSITVDIENGETTARLPFMHDPKLKLAENKSTALAVYNQQVKKLNRCPKDKSDVIESEKKLQILGHVDFLRNLTNEQQARLNESQKYFIPWRAVWKSNSLSTPCRIVFDASQATRSGHSLNDILAKGRNNMNKLVEVVIRWMSHHTAFHTDIQKMYNSVKLKEKDWCFQRYMWQDQLDPTKQPEEKVIKTLIYGVKSSGNQAERGLRVTAEISKEQYPKVHRIVHKDIYVDDCLSGEASEELAMQRADELELILNRGGFSLKGISLSGRPPPEQLSSDGESICVAGMRWYTKDDMLSLDVSELNFSKKCRGKKSENESNKNVIPDKLTRRHCVSKVSEIYDLVGKFTPITASMKLDLHELIKLNLDWDDVIPTNLRSVWESNFETMQEINNIKFKRAIVPGDAVDLKISTVGTGDASKQLACAAVYARFKRSNGEYSCQLVFSRSKILPENITQPRAELIAAVLNVHTCEIVEKAFHPLHDGSLKLTDSQIVLHWINNNDLPLKQWVRNRVIEIKRFTKPGDWKYVKSDDMIADLGTRRGTNLKQVNQDSDWINGFKWMIKDVSMFPTLSYSDIKLSHKDTEEVNSESTLKYEFDRNKHNHSYNASVVREETQERYKFSQYLIDPNKHRFRDIVRIIALVIKFVNKLKEKPTKVTCRCSSTQSSSSIPNNSTISITDAEIHQSEQYFFKKATNEVKQFLKAPHYDKIAKEVNGILFYKGRILPNQPIPVIGDISAVMKDLCSTTFSVPIIEKHSPLAYSIVNEIHWHQKGAMHSGNETVWRYVLKKAYIIEGRELVKKFRKNCQRCRFIMKKTIDMEMGPVSTYNLTIAPSFYITQVDLAGPFKSYSQHNKRSTIKVWLAIFCCTTTSTVSIKVMEDYSSLAFIQSFIRFSCEFGYPKIILTDEGSQLLKACESMRLNFQDIQRNLSLHNRVEFETCPVGGHNMHGRVERVIREVRSSLGKSVHNERLSILQWETVCAEITNTLNDQPLALRNYSSNLENLDLITPNRLRLGRNNSRSPVGELNVTNHPEAFFKDNKRIFNTWFETWLVSHVPQLTSQPKWFKSDYDIKKGDIVLFLKSEKMLCSTYQYGMISSVDIGSDGKIRKVIVQYRNSSEDTFRETRRAVRELIMIHPIDELNIIEDLGNIASLADTTFVKSRK